MNKPMTKAEREAIYDRSKHALDILLNDPNNIGTRKELEAWFTWNRLSIEEQRKILNAWSKYYEDIKQTPSYLIFQEQRAVSMHGDWARVKELAQDARNIRENKDYVLKKPTSIDPWEFRHSETIKAYERLQIVIKELTNYPEADQEESLKKVFE